MTVHSRSLLRVEAERALREVSFRIFMRYFEDAWNKKGQYDEKAHTDLVEGVERRQIVFKKILEAIGEED